MESKSKFPLWLALVIYVWLCIMVFVVVVGYFTPISEVTKKDYNSYENYHKVYLDTVKYPTLYRSGNGLWSPTRVRVSDPAPIEKW